MMSCNLTSKKLPTETEYGVWKLFLFIIENILSVQWFYFRKQGFVIFLTGATETDFFEIGWWNYMTIASKPPIPFLWRIFEVRFQLIMLWPVHKQNPKYHVNNTIVKQIALIEYQLILRLFYGGVISKERFIFQILFRSM